MTLAVALGAFAIAVLGGWFVPARPARIGCGLPVLAIVLMLGAIVAMRMAGQHVNSTASVGVMFIAIFVACGSVPGALLGAWMRQRRSGSV